MQPDAASMVRSQGDLACGTTASEGDLASIPGFAADSTFHNLLLSFSLIVLEVAES